MHLCIDAYETAEARRNCGPRRQHAVWELFERQDQAYRDEILPPHITARVSVEMGSVIGWDRYAGATGAKIGMRDIRRLGAAQGSPDEIRLHAERTCLAAAKEQIAKSKGEMHECATQNETVHEPAQALHDHGQAVWLDFLSRGFIAEGGLKKLVEQDGLTGVTSNPSIFEKAIGRQRRIRRRA